MKSLRAYNWKSERRVQVNSSKVRDDEDFIAPRFQGESMCWKNSKGKCFWGGRFLGNGTCSYTGAKEGLYLGPDPSGPHILNHLPRNFLSFLVKKLDWDPLGSGEDPLLSPLWNVL